MLEFEEDTKGQITQSILRTLLVHCGYRVVRLGIEEQLNEVMYLDALKYAKMDLPRALRLLPDILAIDTQSDVPFLVEVKYRKNFSNAVAASLYERLKEQLSFWPTTCAAIMISESFWGDRGYSQDHLRMIGGDELNKLVDGKLEPMARWDSLKYFHGVFTLAKDNLLYYKGADKITTALMSLRTL